MLDDMDHLCEPDKWYWKAAKVATAGLTESQCHAVASLYYAAVTNAGKGPIPGGGAFTDREHGKFCPYETIYPPNSIPGKTGKGLQMGSPSKKRK
jgi:hypothetical protein